MRGLVFTPLIAVVKLPSDFHITPIPASIHVSLPPNAYCAQLTSSLNLIVAAINLTIASGIHTPRSVVVSMFGSQPRGPWFESLARRRGDANGQAS